MKNNLAFIFLLVFALSCSRGTSRENSALESTNTTMTIAVDEDRQQQLMHLLLADCGSCHGMTLQGGLGPSLLAKDLLDKTNQQLFNTIKNGILGTPMPPWQPFLNDNEIHWILNTLRQQSWKK